MSYRILSVLLAVVLACACATLAGPRTKSSPAPATPTKVPAAPVTLELAERDLHIDLSCVVRDSEPLVEVVVAFRGERSGRTELQLPTSWAGRDELWKGLKEIRVDPPAHLEPEQVPGKRTIAHEPSAILRVRYAVPSSAVQDDAQDRQPYLPLVTPAYVHLIGETFLAKPSWGDEALVHGRISWNVPSSWQVAHSFGVGAGATQFEAKLGQVTHAIYVAGDFRLLRTDLRNRPVFVAVRGSWAFTDDELLDLVVRVIDVERGFFGDDDFPHFLITMIPIGSGGCCSYGGTGLTNAFATFIETDKKIDERMKHLLSHELFHTWNGRRIGRVEPERLVYWFSEGFTDFYARLLLLRAGLLDLPGYVKSYNQTLRQYALSPARLEPNSAILERYWTDYAVERLPYQRGDVLAHHWNTRLREHGHSLDDVMLDLFHEAGSQGTVVSPEAIDRLYSHYDARGLGDDLERYVEQGAWLDPEPNALGPCVKLTTVKMGPFDLGFDLEASEKEGKVTGVRRGGGAFRAGLRDGMNLRRARYSNDPTREAEVHVEDRGGRVRVVRYLPQGEQRSVPQYRLDEARYAAEPEACMATFR